MAGEIESGRTGAWANQAIGRLNPGQGVSMIISGPVESDLQVGGVSTVDFTQPEDQGLYLVGLGFRKDTGYKDTLLNCQEIWVPFEENGERRYVTLFVESLTSFTDWIYVWMSRKIPREGNKKSNEIYRNWTPFPESISESGIYDETQIGSELRQELDYEITLDGPGGIIFVPYIHPNYLTTDDYNGILGNVMKTEESYGLYSVLRNDVSPVPYLIKGDRVRTLRDLVSPNLRYKNYLEDYHKPNAIGGLHAGELYVPGGDLSRCTEEVEYFKSFNTRVNELGVGRSGSLQTLDFPFMSYRAISASVYVDRFEEGNSRNSAPLKKVWDDMQGGNVDDPETIFFVNNAHREITGSGAYPYIREEIRTTVPVEGMSILFRMDGHLAVRVTRATVFAPFLNTVYRTGQYGLVEESYTESGSIGG